MPTSLDACLSRDGDAEEARLPLLEPVLVEGLSEREVLDLLLMVCSLEAGPKE